MPSEFQPSATAPVECAVGTASSGIPFPSPILASGKDRWYQFGLGTPFALMAGLSCFFAVWAQLNLDSALAAAIVSGLALMVIGARKADDRSARRTAFFGRWLATGSLFFLFATLLWRGAPPGDGGGGVGWFITLAVLAYPPLSLSVRFFLALRPAIMLYNHTGQTIDSVRLSVGQAGEPEQVLTFDRLRPYARRGLHPAHLHTRWGVSYNLNGTRHDYSQEIALDTVDRYLIEIMPDGSIKPRFNRRDDCLTR
ncbi:MAG TPA: hypothetical protein VG125_30750 [Pirellulales bacterium]|jgi:hypothetical protein|nr:hypothetical protein [Pirellulales bacterium]